MPLIPSMWYVNSMQIWHLTHSLRFFDSRPFGKCERLTWAPGSLETRSKLTADLQGERHPRVSDMAGLLPCPDLLATHSALRYHVDVNREIICPNSWIFHGEHGNVWWFYGFVFMNDILVFSRGSLGQRFRIFSECLLLITCSGKKATKQTKNNPQNPHTDIERIWGLQLPFT